MEHILWSEREVKVRQAALVVLKHIIKGSKSIPMQVRNVCCDVDLFSRLFSSYSVATLIHLCYPVTTSCSLAIMFILLSQEMAQPLRVTYRLLKRVVQEEFLDTVTQTHALAALGELDCVMKAQLFPERKMEKKIVIS